MKALGIVIGGGAPPPPMLCSSVRNQRFRVSFSSSSSSGSKTVEIAAPKIEYKPNVVDDLFLNLFRNKLVQEVGWDSKKPGYDGLIEVANRLMMKGTTNSDTIEATVRILRSLFPPFLLELYKMLIAPLGGGKIAAIMVARVTALTCQWLMGPCKVNSVDLPDGTSCSSGVYVERCKYLEESKCVGICTNTCKFPTQAFFKDHMGVPLLMEPNFGDYSCQFKFGVLPPLPEDDTVLKEPCLEACPNASRRRIVTRKTDITECPKT
ncbi:beta-carotene isomerase D27, chloroplastic isoform X1 [Lotus japonicus]|uniref:beta-carotene isomerase D27, chloroplastic isoform X1 n=1 Tax=Lotus japonicus TaxID=34305 RepID=UPI00258E7B64|nr:beta-carotene isomerase D27, chloroplastic isoform X1 [Lotus japonicus]